MSVINRFGLKRLWDGSEMRKLVAMSLVLLVACSTPTAEGGDKPTKAPVPAPAKPAPPAPAPAAKASPIVKPPGRTRKIEAPHGGAVTTLALTPDGASAISVDEMGGVRLWPALD